RARNSSVAVTRGWRELTWRFLCCPLLSAREYHSRATYHVGAIRQGDLNARASRGRDAAAAARGEPERPADRRGGAAAAEAAAGHGGPERGRAGRRDDRGLSAAGEVPDPRSVERPQPGGPSGAGRPDRPGEGGGRAHRRGPSGPGLRPAAPAQANAP